MLGSFDKVPKRSWPVHLSNTKGWTPLHSAVSAGHEPVVKELLKLGADVNSLTAGRRTPLHYAASKGWLALITLLLHHGADVTVQDNTGSTALHRAASAGKVEAARLLIETGRAQVDARDKQGSTPLMVAVSCDFGSLALYLVGKGADVEQGALPAKGKEYPGLGYKRMRDKPPKAQEQQQQPAVPQ
ncbi:hypothetical protein QJQ45_027236 [Haematococcus lacustris]|nr:hypothetical protein QJQ45_027236 [Haematococcus lacustris]